ncbi:alanine dehydrogenase [candidate division MSBL1 archaeon SCGC-AAA259A05]|uniref:Alanine dehydrogenase n=1 Tax=candidate division MSBL1 archaeon SCGC-AAA259A05 TaxID=1698259 RepID=A0A133U9H7_9EURY|nr:alanine dehydrogenase [candidate division MSBL1 archaeon SCGC-AAA259A05]
MKVRTISGPQIEKLISMKETIEAVEKAFRSKGLGRVQMPPKSYVYFDKYQGDFRTMPAYLEDLDVAGTKVVNAHPQNPHEHDLPTVMATIILLDPKNGRPQAVMDGTLITRLRTGAAGGIAAKYLARGNSRVVAMIGAGTQARTQLLAMDQISDIEEVRVQDIVREKAEEYAGELGEELDIDIRVVDGTEEAVRGSDIVVTVTPRRSPILSNDWITEGMHINAIGADAPGKQELDPDILRRARIIVDDWEQSSHSGEISIPISQGKLTRDDICGELGEIIAGKKGGRVSGEDITVFDSTGLAIQDVATAWKVYQKAEERDVGNKVDLL